MFKLTISFQAEVFNWNELLSALEVGFSQSERVEYTQDEEGIVWKDQVVDLDFLLITEDHCMSVLREVYEFFQLRSQVEAFIYTVHHVIGGSVSVTPFQMITENDRFKLN